MTMVNIQRVADGEFYRCDRHGVADFTAKGTPVAVTRAVAKRLLRDARTEVRLVEVK